MGFQANTVIDSRVVCVHCKASNALRFDNEAQSMAGRHTLDSGIIGALYRCDSCDGLTLLRARRNGELDLVPGVLV